MQYIMSIVIFMDHLYIPFLRDMFILHIYIINHITKRNTSIRKNMTSFVSGCND